MTPASSTELTLNGAAAQIGDLQLGDYVTVRRNPETGELRQIIASRKGTATAAPAGDVRSRTSRFRRPVRCAPAKRSTSSCTARRTAERPSTSGIMSPISRCARTFRAPTGPANDSRALQPDRCPRLRSPAVGGRGPKATSPAQFSAATTPPQIVDIAPPGGQTVNTSRPNIYATFRRRAKWGSTRRACS